MIADNKILRELILNLNKKIWVAKQLEVSRNLLSDKRKDLEFYDTTIQQLTKKLIKREILNKNQLIKTLKKYFELFIN